MLRGLVRAGGDTDTIASIAGQICGAHLGRSGLPAEMLERLPEKELLYGVAQRFARSVSPLGK